jgi:site-specific recombinase XerD
VQHFLSGLQSSKKRPTSAQTKNYYLRDFKSFYRWAVRDGWLGQSPVEYLRPIDAKQVRGERRRERRAASVNEISKLLRVTAAEPERFGMAGPERALLYRLTIETGLKGGRVGVSPDGPSGR